jgi:hypothetical protein
MSTTRLFRRKSSRGQSLAELAIVLPILLALVGGVIQFGITFWAQNTITQVARDTGRWAATQQLSPCNTGASDVADQADRIAAQSSLIGYDGQWTSGITPLQATRPNEGVEVEWPIPTDPPGLIAADCPPSDNQTAWFVTVRLSHEIPVLVPGLQYLPQLGTCTPGGGCTLSVSSTATFRMEPAPAPPCPTC